VFLSYASQDSDAARRICEALRAAGIEVWFDQSELRGGEVWDQTIRRQIKACALFIPVLSRHTHERREGYFRLEWKLAVDRSNLISATQAFLLPVVIDETREDDEEVPEKIRDIHWIRLPAGETPPAFVDRVRRLLSSEPSTPARQPTSAQSETVGLVRAPVQGPWSPERGLLVAAGLVVLGAVAYFTIETVRVSNPPASSPTVAATAVPAAFNPPPHSIAVLPFVNMSGDQEQEYFSEGLTEELLNSLSRIKELQVAARTSSFSFQGEHPDIATVAHKLNVGAVLEGSVRRSTRTVRVTAQLVNAVTGFHLWSETYDRDLGDVLRLQTEIATAVAGALKVTLLGDEAAKIELGGTHDPAAYDAYLRASKIVESSHEARELPAAIAAYAEAIHLDPHFGLAFARRSIALTAYSVEATTGAAVEGLKEAQADAHQAVALAPELAEAHLASALVAVSTLDLRQATEEYKLALALAPGNAEVLRRYGLFAVCMGQFDAGLTAIRRAVLLDPIASTKHFGLGFALYYARRYEEAVTALAEVITLDPDNKATYGLRGLAYFGLGNRQSARESCEMKSDHWVSQWCLAVVYDKLGLHTDAEAQLSKMKAAQGDAMAYQYATIYAQWGNRTRALEWLDTAMRLRDSGIQVLKTDPLLDPLRNEPRFQAVMRELKFPQ
jgi:TolB-like protein/tetratricopeptide (TPR) repeat protein